MRFDVARGLALSLAVLAGTVFASPDFEIEWGRPYSLGPGGYARIRRLADGRYMLVYGCGADMAARYSRKGAPEKWSKPQTVARHFASTNGEESGWVSLANAEVAQLDAGRLVFACNLRPKNPKAHPYAIAVMTSDDAGRTWSPPRTVYRAEVPGFPEAPSRGCGCWEPFVLPLGGGRAQIYFADETPYYRPGKDDRQDISYLETADGGETWSGPKKACYTPDRRDGMPVVMDLGKRRYLAIEADPQKTKLHPQIVMCPADGGWENSVRFEPLANPPDWNEVYGGAPYITATENYVLLSWQESALPGDPVSTSVARVAAVPKDEIAADGTFRTMCGISTPPGIGIGRDRMLWNSLCPVGGDGFLLVSEVKGEVMVYPGKIVSGICGGKDKLKRSTREWKQIKEEKR